MSEHNIAGRPLQGKRILVTRTRDQAGVLSERLRSLGAIPVEFPTIRIVSPQDWEPLDAALKRLYTSSAQVAGNSFYDWIVFTSANGVNICFERLRTLGYDPQALRDVRVAAIGPATAAALARYGISADLVPDKYIAESVAAALIEDAQRCGNSIVGQRILLARAAQARRVLVTELQQAGALVDEIPAYFTATVARDDEQGHQVLHLLQERQLAILTFTSSSTVRNFVEWLNSCEQIIGDSPLDLIASQISIACIGPITAQTARELGLSVDIEAKEFTIDGLVTAIIQHEERL